MANARKRVLKLVGIAALALVTPVFAQNVEYDLPHHQLTSEITRLTLIGNLARDRNQPEIAYKAYLLLAGQTRDPRYAELAYRVALAAQEPQAAIDAALVLRQLAPNAVLGQDLITQVKIGQAYALIDKQQYRPAYDAAKAILAQDAKNVGALSLLTAVADILGYDAESLQAAEDWVKLEPENPEALNSLGYYLANKNLRLVDAEQLINKANQLKPNTPHIMDSMGWLAYRQGRLDAALPLIKQASIMEPHEDVLTHLGEILWQKGEKNDALKAFQRAFQSNAHAPVLLETLKRLGIEQSAVNVAPVKGKRKK